MNKTIMVISSSLDGRLLTAVETARKLGIRTIACVRREDDPDAAFADKAYCVNGDETERLLEIARKESIDGILGVWDKSSMSAAIIAKELGLSGNSPECISTFLEKGKFRKLQKEAGVFYPKYYETDSVNGLKDKVSGFKFPIILKPSICSSSFGQMILENADDIEEAFQSASSYSEDKFVCVEEFVEHKSLKVLEADIFIVGDDIIWDGMCYCYRFPEAPLRPVLSTYPVILSEDEENEYRTTIKKVLSKSNAKTGEFNVEGFFTEEGRFFIIEINPRPGGYYFQQEIEAYCNIDFTKLLVTTALNDMSYFNELKTFKRERNYILMYAVFSFKAGIYDHLYIDSRIKDSLLIFRSFPGGEKGAYIEDINADNRPVGVALFKFSSEEELENARENIRKLVYVVLK